MKAVIAKRLEALREVMKEKKIDACIVLSSDPHMSEYLPTHDECRAWISGFDGSAGTAVITQSFAGLWTDSRYFLQAESQLSDTEFVLFKEGLPETPSISAFLASSLPKGKNIGIDGNVFPMAAVLNMRSFFESKSLNLITGFAPFDKIWKDRPSLPTDPIYIYKECYSGEATLERQARILGEVKKLAADSILITALDDVAWAFNIRGCDIPCNPVAVAYGVISKDERILFIDPAKVEDDSRKELDNQNITLRPYNQIHKYLSELCEETKILIDDKKVNFGVYNSIPSPANCIVATSPIGLMKSKKNETEIKGCRNAMIKDGIALVQFFRWLEDNIKSGDVTERTIGERLTHFRSQQPLYMGESFGTIAGYNEHGAIVHYHATPESNSTLRAEGMLLIDSGAQYLDGTTDITRTIALGMPTDKQKEDYTRVLKGHIAIATIKFPYGTRGSQLDILARQFLWKKGVTYLHGTGHGVGHFLNVHEGPQNIRLEENSTLFLPGMITSNEPGIYRTDEYGIRTENLILCRHCESSPFGDFFDFETLTLYPFDKNLIALELLSDDEIKWINDYHQTVYNQLTPLLNDEEQMWLKQKTSKITK